MAFVISQQDKEKDPTLSQDNSVNGVLQSQDLAPTQPGAGSGFVNFDKYLGVNKDKADASYQANMAPLQDASNSLKLRGQRLVGDIAQQVSAPVTGNETGPTNLSDMVSFQDYQKAGSALDSGISAFDPGAPAWGVRSPKQGLYNFDRALSTSGRDVNAELNALRSSVDTAGLQKQLSDWAAKVAAAKSVQTAPVSAPLQSPLTAQNIANVKTQQTQTKQQKAHEAALKERRIMDAYAAKVAAAAKNRRPDGAMTFSEVSGGDKTTSPLTFSEASGSQDQLLYGTDFLKKRKS